MNLIQVLVIEFRGSSRNRVSAQDIRPGSFDITATRFAAATKTCGCYNGRIEVVVNLSSMRVCDAQAADSPEIAAAGRRSVSRWSAVTTKRLCDATKRSLGRFAGSTAIAGLHRRDNHVGNVANMHPIDGAHAVRMPQTPIVSRVTPGSSLDA
jgi:hypothetical protein